MNITQQMQKDFDKARHVGAMQFSFTSTNKRGLSAMGINMNVKERLERVASKCGASVTLVSGMEGNTRDVMVLEITDPLASHIEKCKGSANA